MNQWVLNGKPEMIAVPIDMKKFKDGLAEIAQLLLDYFRQLDPKLIPVPIRPRPSYSRHNEEVRQ